MKQIFTLFFLFSLVVNAGEIHRLKSIVSDIDKTENDLQRERDKNRELNKELKLYLSEIKNLSNQINILEKNLKSKKLTNKIVKVEKKCSLTTQIKEENNPFPPLVMKTKYQKESQLNYFKASSFRINGQVKIYNSVDGSAVAVWSDKTSFTSNQRVGKWIKITGLFVNKVWQPAGQELWVKSCDVLNRTQESK